MRTHRRITLLPLLLAGVLALASVTGCSRWTLPQMMAGVIEPSIVPSSEQKGFRTVEREFTFEESLVELRVPVDQAVYAGAVEAEKSTVFIGRAQPSDWVSGHYRAFVEEEHQEAFYVALLDALHQVRDSRNLSTSRYVELVTSMVQSLEYRVDPVSLAPKFPIETFADGYGDCDDKALLAAALLARDGYDVSILFFEPEAHVSLGVRAPGLEYKSTGYGYVEVTEPSLVGVPTEKLSGDVALDSKPVVIKIGEGESEFAAGDKIAFIQRALKEAQAAMKKMSGQIARDNAELSERKTELEEAKRAAESASTQASAVVAIERYNRLVNEYNALVARTNKLVARYNAFVDAERYSVENRTSRPQIEKRLRDLPQ